MSRSVVKLNSFRKMKDQKTEDLYHESKKSSSIDPETIQCSKRDNSLSYNHKCEERPKCQATSLLAERKIDTTCLLEELVGANCC